VYFGKVAARLTRRALGRLPTNEEAEMNKKEILSHVIWIGGPTDSGKTTLATYIAKMKGYQYYSSDQTGGEHLRKLAQTNTKHKKYIESVLDVDERWTGYTAEEIAEQSMEIARERFQFVIEDLIELPNHTPIIAEGLSFTPEIIYPVMTSEYQGIWLMPTQEIMEKSFRKKASFLKSRMGDQAETTINHLLQVSIYLMDVIKSQAEQCGCKVYEIGEKKTIEENAANVWAHFSQYSNE
jgi:2-phosphoglycerate kinase